MQACRRRFLQQSLALLAAPRLEVGMPHVVLLGDSIFDNGAYTGGKPDVITQLRQVLPRSWRATLRARDGATTDSIPAQLMHLPPDASQLVLSIGGNNALRRENLLQAPASSLADAILMLDDVVRDFEGDYRKTIDACLGQRLPLVICTIYNGNFDDPRYRRLTTAAIALFNDVILRVAVERRLKVIELRLVCATPQDYANPIEPSSAGAARIARAIAAAVTRPAIEGQGAFVIS